MSVPADLERMSDEALRLLEKASDADPESSEEAKYRFREHLVHEWRRRTKGGASPELLAALHR